MAAQPDQTQATMTEGIRRLQRNSMPVVKRWLRNADVVARESAAQAEQQPTGVAA